MSTGYAVGGMTQPYKVLTGCGHVVIRRMRPDTAGVEFSGAVVLQAPNGMPCPKCAGEVREHVGAADCSIDPVTFCCVVCGVDHSEACSECRQTGFHGVGCSAREVR